MEPGNRPYVDPSTKPGDEGTEAWSDNEPGQDPGSGRPSTDPEGAIVGSPADLFDDGDAIESMNDHDDGGHSA